MIFEQVFETGVLLDCSQSPISAIFETPATLIELPPCLFVNGVATWGECLNYRGWLKWEREKDALSSYQHNVQNINGRVFSFSFSPRGRFVLQTEISGKNLSFLKNKYISVILVVCSIKLVTSAVGISLPLIFCI